MNHTKVFRVKFEKISTRNLRTGNMKDDLEGFKVRVVKGAREQNGWRGNVGVIRITKEMREREKKVKLEQEEGSTVESYQTVKAMEEHNIYSAFIDFTCFPKRYRTDDAAYGEAANFINVLSKAAPYRGWEVTGHDVFPDTTVFEIEESNLPVYPEVVRKPRKPKTSPDGVLEGDEVLEEGEVEEGGDSVALDGSTELVPETVSA